VKPPVSSGSRPDKLPLSGFAGSEPVAKINYFCTGSCGFLPTQNQGFGLRLQNTRFFRNSICIVAIASII
jgi:hypothetical protein